MKRMFSPSKSRSPTLRRGNASSKPAIPPSHGYVVMSGTVRVTTMDEDQQEVLVDEPAHGEFFGFASMLQQTEHQTTAMAMEEVVCMEIGRDDIEALLKRRPMAGMDMLTVQARQFHSSQKLIRSRANRNPNEVIEEQETFGERIADGGRALRRFVVVHHSVWVVLMTYTSISVALGKKAGTPIPLSC